MSETIVNSYENGNWYLEEYKFLNMECNLESKIAVH